MSNKMAPFEFDALRPFVSVTLHEIDPKKSHPDYNSSAIAGKRKSKRIASELAENLASLFDAFDIDGKNPYKISTLRGDRGIIKTKNVDGLSLTGVWFKRVTAPAWLDANQGPEEVRDTINYILLLAIRFPYLAVLGTHDGTRIILSKGLEQGNCGGRQLDFIAPVIEQEKLEQAFVRGQTRVFWLSGLHARVETKPDSKTLIGRDLRQALDPFSDQTFTFTSTVSILPELQVKRTPGYDFGDNEMTKNYAHYAFRVGTKPEQRKVWTVHAKEFKHLLEEFRVLFDTLGISSSSDIGAWGYHQDGFKFLRKPIPVSALSNVKDAFDVGLDLPPPADPGNDINVSSERERCRELWRAYGQMQVIDPSKPPGSASFSACVLFDGKPLIEFDVEPRDLTGRRIAVYRNNSKYLASAYDEGVTCFETLTDESSDVTMTIRYDSGHVIRGSRLFDFGWQDVLFESWEWRFRPVHGGHTYSADKEKPDSTSKEVKIASRQKGLGWEGTLGMNIGDQGSLFEYVVANATWLFKPSADHEWHLCCDDGPGEVADFVYFEPGARRLYLIHIKGAATDSSNRGISVKAYEEVVSQAVKNLRYLDVGNLADLLEKGKRLPIAQACFCNKTDKPDGSRDKILKALRDYEGRLLDKRVIVFQPHVRQSEWKKTNTSWGVKNLEPTPKNQINRFLQLRTLLADAEITCRKMGARFEVWGEDDAPAKTLPEGYAT